MLSSSQKEETTEDTVILQWLKAELNSSRFSGQLKQQIDDLGTTEEIILNGDTSIEEENRTRKEILDFRGYLRRIRMFATMPQDLNWYEERVKTDELLEKSLYLKDPYWIDLSKGTRKPLAAADTVKSGQNSDDEDNVAIFKAISQDIINKNRIPPLIAITDNKKIILIEGHARITAYAMTKECAPKELDIYVGYSDDLTHWDFY